jgi:predicted nucleic acid-binding protein
MIVIDANVAAKWFLPERGSQEAVTLQEGPDQLFGPDLLRMEVAAAITRRVRAKEKPLPPQEAIDRCTQWFRLLDRAAVTLLPESALLDEATRLSVKLPHTLQDCLYLAAAMHLDAPLITGDQPFYQRAAQFYPRISLLPGCNTN